jgi:hypothetical protein
VGDEDREGHEPRFDKALRGVPQAKNPADEWAHEGRVRPVGPVGGLGGLGEGEGEGEGHPESPLELLRKPDNTKPPELSEEEIARRKLIRLGVIGGAVVVLIVGSAAAYRLSQPKVRQSTDPGSITVSSDPEGATIVLSGEATAQVTPSELKALVTGVPFKVTVKKAGFLPEPELQEVVIPPTTGQATVGFKLVPAKTVRIVTEPAGAEVTVDSRVLPGKTPLDLPAMRNGATANVSISLSGHVGASMKLVARTDTATLARFRLERAKTIELETDPPGATITINGEEVGQSPLNAFNVPAEKPFLLTAEHAGFEKWKHTYSVKAFGSRLSIELKMLPLSKMPISKTDKAKAAELEHKYARAKAALAAARASQMRAEDALRKAEAGTHTFVSELAGHENAVERARTKVEEVEGQVDEARDELEQFREQIVSQLAGDSGDPKE